MSYPVCKELKDSFPELSTVLSLPARLITGPGEFWKPKLLNVLVKKGVFNPQGRQSTGPAMVKPTLSGCPLIGLQQAFLASHSDLGLKVPSLVSKPTPNHQE